METITKLENNQNQFSGNKKKIILSILILLFIANSIFAFFTSFSMGEYDYKISVFYFKIFLYFIPFELGVLIGLLITRFALETIFKVVIILAILASLLPILSPYFIFFFGMFFAIIYSFFCGLAGLCVGYIIKTYSKMSLVNIFGIVILLSILINILVANIILNKANNCDVIVDTEKRDNCFQDKSIRNKDMSNCEKLSSPREQGDCYVGFLFDFEYENVQSFDQCNVIPNEKTKDYCYDFAAKATQSTAVCQKMVDINLSKKCMIGVQRNICAKIIAPSKKAACEAVLNELMGNQEQEVEQQNLQTNNIKTDDYYYAKYREMYAAEEKSGDTSHVKSKRFSDINTIKRTVENMQKYALECNRKGEKIKSSDNGMGTLCSGPMNWAVLMDICGEKQSDTNWIVNYDNNEWNYTLSCKKYPECSNVENVKCTGSSCVFSEKCN